MKKTKALGIMMMAVGAFFLINPTVNIIDIIPDFIGYLLIVLGIDRLADMEDHFAEAKKGFVLLTVVSAAKTASCLLLSVIDGTFVILLSFAFALLEALFFIPAMTKLFGGFNYYGLRLESKACEGIYKKAYVKDENGNKVNTMKKARSSDSILALSVIAFVIRALCYFLPQLPTLFSYGDSAVINGEYVRDMADFIPHMYVLCAVVVLAVSLPWAISFCRYIKGIAGDEALIATLEEKYNESVAPNENYFAEKKTKAVWVVTILAAVFCFSIYIDYVNWLPSGVACVFFAVVALMLKKSSRAAVPTAVFGFLGIIPSALEVILQYQYTELKYTPSSFLYGIGQSKVLYPRIIVAEAVSAVFLIVCIWLAAKCIEGMIREHCVLYEKSRPETRGGKGGELCASIMREYRIAFSLMTAMAVVSAFHGFVAVYYPEIWILNILLGVVMAVFLFRAHAIAHDDLYDRLTDRT